MSESVKSIERNLIDAGCDRDFIEKIYKSNQCAQHG